MTAQNMLNLVRMVFFKSKTSRCASVVTIKQTVYCVKNTTMLHNYRYFRTLAWIWSTERPKYVTI